MHVHDGKKLLTIRRREYIYRNTNDGRPTMGAGNTPEGAEVIQLADWRKKALTMNAPGS